MKSLNFKNIKYKNLMSVGNAFIDISLSDYKNTLITGKNGSAKSTILEAIFYALFDSPFRKIKMSQLINSTNNKNLIIELELTNGNDHVIIKRGQKPSIFEIIVNDVSWDMDGSKKDTQERLEKYLGINAVSFRQVVVLGTAGYKPFMELTTPERRKLVDDILDLTAIAQMDKLNKDIIRNVNQEFSLATVKIDGLEDKKNSLMKINENQEIKLKEANTRIQLQIDALQSEQSDVKSQLMQKKKEFDSLEHTEFDLDSFRARRDIIKENISKLNYENTDLNKKIKLHEMGKCPTCEGDLDSSHAEDLKPMIAENETKKEKLNNALQTIETAYNKHIQQTQMNERVKNELTQLSQKFKEVSTKISYLETSFQSMPETIDTKKDIDDCEKSLSSLNAEKAKLVNEKFNRGMLSELLKDSGIKAKVVSYYVPYLNNRINFYLDLLEADYNFTLDSEFNESIKSVGRENFSYHSFSQGEKARIDISMLFAWRDVASKISGTDINLLLLDEVFDGASDSDAKSNIMGILKKLDSNIFVISHADHDPQEYQRHIQMTKVGRFSQMAETLYNN